MTPRIDIEKCKAMFDLPFECPWGVWLRICMATFHRTNLNMAAISLNKLMCIFGWIGQSFKSYLLIETFACTLLNQPFWSALHPLKAIEHRLTINMHGSFWVDFLLASRKENTNSLWKESDKLRRIFLFEKTSVAFATCITPCAMLLHAMNTKWFRANW